MKFLFSCLTLLSICFILAQSETVYSAQPGYSYENSQYQFYGTPDSRFDYRGNSREQYGWDQPWEYDQPDVEPVSQVYSPSTGIEVEKTVTVTAEESKQRVYIVDIDDTLLEESDSAILTAHRFIWGIDTEAVPGAVDAIRKLIKKGKVIGVTSRKESMSKQTEKNLRKEGFPKFRILYRGGGDGQEQSKVNNLLRLASEGVDISKAKYVGDRERDYKSAEKAIKMWGRDPCVLQSNFYLLAGNWNRPNGVQVVSNWDQILSSLEEEERQLQRSPY